MSSFSGRARATALRGFTLIELLIVMAIIAILATLLFPVFATARDRARQAACTGNLKQIYTAYRLYAMDYDGKWPMKVVMGMGLYRRATDPQSIPYLMDPYVRNNQIWLCPSGVESMKQYGVNYYFSIGNFVNGDPDLLEGTGNGTNQVVAQDNYLYSAPSNVNPPGVTTQSGHAFYSKPYPYPHRGKTGFNELFVDGHVKLDW